MFREIKSSDIPWAEGMLKRINSSAKVLFHEAIQSGNLVKAYIYEMNDNKGIVSIIKGDDYYSIQISFQEDLYNYDAIEIIEKEIKNVLNMKGSYDVYLNVNGYNVALLGCLRNLGFVQDSLGFEFCLHKQNDIVKRYQDIQIEQELTIKKYEDEYSEVYLRLLDDSFRQQNINCGQEQDVYVNKYAVYELNKIRKSNDDNSFFSFWLGKQLVGICFFDKNYLDTIAVDPMFERKGYGSKIMKYCIYDRFFIHHYDEIYLHTYLQNHRAQRLYLRCGFNIRGFYSENTFSETLPY